MSATLGGFVMKAVARAVSGPKFLARTIGVATLAVAQSLVQLVHNGLATDIKEMKDSLITSAKAEAELKKHKATQALAKAKSDMAKAEKVVADAEKDVNEINIKKRIEQSKLLEAEQEQIEKAKSEREQAKLRREIEEKRLRATNAAYEVLEEKLQVLKNKGGNVAFDLDNLQKIIEHPLPPEPKALPPSVPVEPPIVEIPEKKTEIGRAGKRKKKK